MIVLLTHGNLINKHRGLKSQVYASKKKGTHVKSEVKTVKGTSIAYIQVNRNKKNIL